MSTTTRLTFADYEKLPEKEGVRYELDEGTLLMEPSPALNHNLIRQRIASHLTQFVRSHNLGIVVEEMDFRLDTDTVRNPDVAFITADHLRNIDPYASPVEGASALAIEVISPSNLAQDTAKKVRQYLAAGCQAVWLVIPRCGWLRSTMLPVPSASLNRSRSRNPNHLADSSFLCHSPLFSTTFFGSNRACCPRDSAQIP
jgi:Uma2 family endonuclease